MWCGQAAPVRWLGGECTPLLPCRPAQPLLPCRPSASPQVLTKSLLPLPDKWHGLSDVEQRYRKRCD